MMFGSPAFLALFALIAVLSIYEWRYRTGAEGGLGMSSLSAIRDLSSRTAFWWNRARGTVRLVSLALLALALARPQQGLKDELQSVRAADIMLCLDCSDSMRAEDFAPKNRITVAKAAARSFIEKREQDRIGLAIFGRIALTQCPLTTDYAALLGLLDGVEVGIVPQDRTAIGDAIALCASRLKDSAAQSKVIVLLTDGANNAGKADPKTAAEAAAAFGIKVYTIGAGSPSGGYITVDHPFFGRQKVKVADSLDEESLTRIAEATRGRYFRATNAKGLRTIFEEINKLEKTEIEVTAFTEKIERFEWFLIPGLVFLGLELVLGIFVFKGIP